MKILLQIVDVLIKSSAGPSGEFRVSVLHVLWLKLLNIFSYHTHPQISALTQD